MTIKPVSTCIGPQNELIIGGVSVEDLVSQYGSPLYVMDEETIRHNCQSYTKTLDNLYPDYTLAYASKAGMTKSLLDILASEGLGADVVSGGELFTAQNSTINVDKIYFHGNNKSDKELRMAITSGVRLVIDNPTESKRIRALCDSEGLHAKVLIRLKPEIEAHTHDYIKTGQIDSKFGVSKEELLDEIKHCITHPKIAFLGIHGHIGSQIFDIHPYEDLAHIMVGHMATIKKQLGIDIQELNLGGGIGITYTESDDPPTIPEVLRRMTDALIGALKKHQLPMPKLILEPGRSIVATAGVTLYTVGAIKNIPGIKRYVFIDGGMADNPRPILYQSDYTFAISKKPLNTPVTPYTIAGKFCESGDILGKDIYLANPVSGDIMIVYGTGAYNYAMASNYNRFCRPAMALVHKGQSRLIVKRETYEDLIRHDR